MSRDRGYYGWYPKIHYIVINATLGHYRILQHHKPRYFILENVPNLVDTTVAKHSDRFRAFEGYRLHNRLQILVSASVKLQVERVMDILGISVGKTTFL